MLNGLTQERHDALLAQLKSYVADHADDLPKADAAYRELYGDQIDLFTFRQVWRRACIERAAEPPVAEDLSGTVAGAEATGLSQDNPPAGTPSQADDDTEF